MANHRPAETHEGDIGLAFREGLAKGLRLHLPDAVGLLTKGAILCAFTAFAHFVLGVDLGPSAAFGGLGTGGYLLAFNKHRR